LSDLDIKQNDFVYSVDIMASKLDSENLGIITQNSFFEEFFAGETTPEVPKKFTLYHYNGLPRSCHDKKVNVEIFLVVHVNIIINIQDNKML
jgi:hypothetical protein